MVLFNIKNVDKDKTAEPVADTRVISAAIQNDQKIVP